MSIPQDRRWLWWSEPKVSVLSIANQAAFAIKLGYHMATRKSAEQCRLHSKFKYIWFLLFILFFILNVSLLLFMLGPPLSICCFAFARPSLQSRCQNHRGQTSWWWRDSPFAVLYFLPALVNPKQHTLGRFLREENDLCEKMRNRCDPCYSLKVTSQ